MKTLFSVITILSSMAIAQAQDLNLETAKKAARESASFSARKGWKVTIAIVNAEGKLVYLERGDGSYVGSIDAAIQKAESANAFQRPTSAFVEGVKTGRMGLLSVKGVVALEGGVPLLLNGVHVGAIGISGAKSTEDEEAAVAGAKALNY